MIANERLQQTSNGFGFSTVSSLPFANYLEADIMLKGTHHSEEMKDKLRTGKFINCKECGKYYEGRGKDYCSRGCVSKIYGYKRVKPTEWRKISKKIYDSNEFKKWKKIVIERDKKCMICGVTKKLEPHHLVSIFICYYEPFPSLMFNPKNGITLCSSCHSKIECKPKIRGDKNLNWASPISSVKSPMEFNS